MVPIKVRSYIVLGIDHQSIGCNRGANHTRERISQDTSPLAFISEYLR
jgi:hypothetical protein